MNPKDKFSPESINAVTTQQPFAQMDAGQKVLHVGKVIVFFLTAGFAFPGILSD